MGRDVTPSSWAMGHFSAEAPNVIVRVVTALAKARQASWRVQEAAAKEGASNRRPYGSMWEAKYEDMDTVRMGRGSGSWVRCDYFG